MLTPEDNELVTGVGAGTPMGDTMRRYWIPALLVRELAEPDCPPVRVRLLGEDLVAFRDTEGRVGLLDELRASEGVLPRDADWRQPLTPEMATAAILQTV